MTSLRNILPMHKHDASDASTEPKEGHHGHHGHHLHHHHGDHEHHHLQHARARKNAMSAYVNNKWRNEIVAALAEFAGTFMFLCMSEHLHSIEDVNERVKELD
jgi:aquaporin related protein